MVGPQLEDMTKVESCLLEVAVRLQDLSQLSSVVLASISHFDEEQYEQFLLMHNLYISKMQSICNKKVHEMFVLYYHKKSHLKMLLPSILIGRLDFKGASG